MKSQTAPSLKKKKITQFEKGRTMGKGWIVYAGRSPRLGSSGSGFPTDSWWQPTLGPGKAEAPSFPNLLTSRVICKTQAGPPDQGDVRCQNLPTGCGLAPGVGRWGEGQHLPPAPEETLPFSTHTPGPWVLEEMLCAEGQTLRRIPGARASEDAAPCRPRADPMSPVKNPGTSATMGHFFPDSQGARLRDPLVCCLQSQLALALERTPLHPTVLWANSCGDLECTKSSRSHSPHFRGREASRAPWAKGCLQVLR